MTAHTDISPTARSGAADSSADSLTARPGGAAKFDRSVALLILKIGRYPLGQGSLGATRSLGRVGVPVFAVTEDRFTPVTRSRFLTEAFVSPTTGQEDEGRLVEMVQSLVRKLPQPAVVLPTDDESAVLLAEHAGEFGPKLIVPAIEPSLPRLLANKRGLHDVCVANDFPTPRTAFPESRDDVETFADTACFPVVVKNLAPFDRYRIPAVAHTTVVAAREELLLLLKDWPDPPPVLLQEFIPDTDAEDWFFHGYFNAASECLVGFTAVKYRCWPPHRGVSTYSRVVVNDELDTAVRALARKIGFCGIVDLDIRLDRRDGRYKLLDFNPRVGAQFRVFETDAGIDVVRALHLDLTGRAVPEGKPVNGRGMIVEHLDIPAMLAYRRMRPEPEMTGHARGRTELAWFAADDPLPFLAMAARSPSLLRSRLKRH